VTESLGSLDAVPADHPAVKQALVDLLSRLEESVPDDFELTPQRIAEAQRQVSQNMGW